ncbi:MAG: hypothetical protein M3347_01730, partial [Armatimonadota bacterium]|nr:hypothetical protein [Armatimonadota bacterium]
ELRWEQTKGTVDLERSITQFLNRLEREAKKKRRRFQAADHPHLVAKSRKRKAQIVSFGWTGEREDVLDGQGWGVAWRCEECGRIVVAHVIGRGLEKTEKVQKLAAEVLTSLECHGSGGWQTWSVFDLRLEMPEEFLLSRAKIVTGRIEIEWIRPRPPAPKGWTRRDERVAVRRLAAANVLLENETLEDWTERVQARPDKRRAFGAAAETTVRGHPALLLQGVPRHLRRRITEWCLNRLRCRIPPAEMRVWHCEESNKIFVLDCELSPANAHVTQDVLDSLECH